MELEYNVTPHCTKQKPRRGLAGGKRGAACASASLKVWSEGSNLHLAPLRAVDATNAPSYTLAGKSVETSGNSLIRTARHAETWEIVRFRP